MNRPYAHLLALGCLFLGVVSLPSSIFHGLFSNPNVPIQNDKSAVSDLLFSNYPIATLPPDDENPQRLSRRAVTVDYILYDITIDGRGLANWEDFLVSGSLIVTSGIESLATTNGPNPVEVVLLSGSPAANPIAGSIRYCTNRALYP